MKQPQQMDEKCYGWLSQFDCQAFLAKILDFCGCPTSYIVDKNQHVLFWGTGMEALTGLSKADTAGSPCISQCAIPGKRNSREQLIKITQPNGSVVEARKKVQVMCDTAGRFAGGIGMFLVPSESERSAKHPAQGLQNFYGIISRSPAMQNVFQIIRNAAETEATVLVRGESGSGKELVANAIHNLSARRDAPFLAVNCAALSVNLLESELFGHVRGAFTGAVKDHHGLFQRADGGTLFLDEVAELPLELQAKLLRVLQERSYLPVGGSRVIQVDVRIVAATHRSLREEVKGGRFREDLMYRLRVVPIFLPPLRERREDISLLIWHFINRHNNPRVRVIEKIDPDAMRVLLDYRWPGNIRELHNVVEYAFAVGRGAVLRLSELPPEFREPSSPEVIKPAQRTHAKLAEADEESAIKQALALNKGRAGDAANQLGMSRATFWRKRKRYGL